MNESIDLLIEPVTEMLTDILGTITVTNTEIYVSLSEVN